jgi:hypothetical protein
MSNDQTTTTKRYANASRVRDGVEFSVGEPEIFLWALSAARILVG